MYWWLRSCLTQERGPMRVISGAAALALAVRHWCPTVPGAGFPPREGGSARQGRTDSIDESCGVG